MQQLYDSSEDMITLELIFWALMELLEALLPGWSREAIVKNLIVDPTFFEKVMAGEIENE